MEYDSFGNVLSESNPAAGDRFKHTGREWDDLAQLYYFRARWYDPSTGRFLSVDPIGFDGGDGNLYRFVANAPFTNSDPTGNTATTEYNVKVSKGTTGTLISQQFRCVGEGILTDLPEIILTQGATAIPNLSGTVVSCAIMPISAQANKKLAKAVVWIELQTKQGPKVVRFIAQKSKGLSSFSIRAVLTCHGKPNSRNAGSALKGGRNYRNNAIGRIFQRPVHHISPKADKKGSKGPQEMRKILAGCCIGINDAVNLIPVNRKFHGTLHNAKTYDKMAKQMKNANKSGCTEVFNTLNKFKNNIANGRRPV